MPGVSTRNRGLEGSDAPVGLVLPGLLYQETLDTYAGLTHVFPCWAVELAGRGVNAVDQSATAYFCVDSHSGTQITMTECPGTLEHQRR